MTPKITVKVGAELAEIVPVFLKNRVSDLPLLKSAIGKGDRETVQRLGHIMKGAGAGCGFEAITKIGIRIEEAARKGELEKARVALNELASYLESIEVVYE